MDRPFDCSKCKKSFKLKAHLKTHKKSCTGFASNIKCDGCGKNFKSERTLKQHRDKCKPYKTYNCEECCQIFKSYSEHLRHRLNEHKKVVCDICEKDLYFTNIKRHMKTVHDGFTQQNLHFGSNKRTAKGKVTNVNVWIVQNISATKVL